MRSFLFLLISLLMPASFLSAGSPHDFNFWVGTWRVSWKDSEGNSKSGINSITRILSDKVIYEQFDGRPGIDLVGKSWTVYVAEEDLWKQTWVDNQGGYLDFTGGIENGQMILKREGLIQGKPGLQRMRFYNFRRNAFEWAWEVSFDNGQSWKLQWHIHYQRINKDS